MGSHLCLCLIYIGYFWNSQRGPHKCPQTSMLVATTMRESPPLTIPPPHPPASSSPIPRLLKPILSLHWRHLWANVLSVPVSPSSQGTWIALSSKQRWEISSLSPVQHCHPRWLSGKESTHQFRRRGFNLWVRKIPWRRKWQPTSYSCLENSMDRGAWQAIVHLVAKSWTQPSD